MARLPYGSDPKDAADELDATNIDLAVALAEVRRLRAGIEAVCSFLPPTSETHIALSALVDPDEDIYSQF